MSTANAQNKYTVNELYAGSALDVTMFSVNLSKEALLQYNKPLSNH